MEIQASAPILWQAPGFAYRMFMLVDEQYFNGWMAALDEMRRPNWRETYVQTTRDIAARRGRSLDVVAKELGLEGCSHAARRTPARRAARTRRPALPR